jgi:metalloendopeptidase OMA1, mitochondrial
MQNALKIISVVFLLTACTTTPISDRQALILIPLSQEIELGKQAYQQTLKDQKDSENTHLNHVLRRVGQRIAAVSDMPNLEWEFRLIESEVKNAFALPGGKVAVYTGMLRICENEAGLATVLSHEIAHVIARHGTQRMSQKMLLSGAMIGASISLRNNTQRSIIMGALGLGIMYGITLPFSRGDEGEADQIGLVYMAKAGYDPEEAIRFWKRFSQAKGDKGPPEWVSTHPTDKTRITGLKTYFSRAKYKYQNVKPQYGLGETFNLLVEKTDNNEPEKPKPVPGVSVETLLP